MRKINLNMFADCDNPTPPIARRCGSLMGFLRRVSLQLDDQCLWNCTEQCIVPFHVTNTESLVSRRRQVALGVPNCGMGSSHVFSFYVSFIEPFWKVFCVECFSATAWRKLWFRVRVTFGHGSNWAICFRPIYRLSCQHEYGNDFVFVDSCLFFQWNVTYRFNLCDVPDMVGHVSLCCIRCQHRAHILSIMMHGGSLWCKTDIIHHSFRCVILT